VLNLSRNRPKWFRKTERLLYDYKTFDSAIRVLEAEKEALKQPAPDYMMPQTSTSIVKMGQGSTKTPFDTSQTERWGIKRAELVERRRARINRKLLDKKRWQEGIREARKLLNHEESQIIWLKYDLEKSHRETWLALQKAGLCMSEMTYYAKREKIVGKVAKCLGII
jgi:hypothetical protein